MVMRWSPFRLTNTLCIPINSMSRRIRTGNMYPIRRFFGSLIMQPPRFSVWRTLQALQIHPLEHRSTLLHAPSSIPLQRHANRLTLTLPTNFAPSTIPIPCTIKA